MSTVNPEKGPRFTPADYARGIDAYIEAGEAEKTLRPHQMEVFSDIHRAFDRNAYKSDVTLPTGTGKTVILVEMSKALLATVNDAGEHPKILVVAPKKDIVHQTMGRSGKRGYGRFAPELQVGSFFSDSTEAEKEKLKDFDVVVTTYKSMRILEESEEYRESTPNEEVEQLERALETIISTYGTTAVRLYEQLDALELSMRSIHRVSTGKKLLDYFDVIITDEAHNLHGAIAGQTIQSMDEKKVVIGFTATPDASDTKRLSRYLPYKVHHMQLHEAIQKQLLAPLVPLAVKNTDFIGAGDVYGADGEYVTERINHLAMSESRNKKIVDSAKTLIDHGVGTVVSCLSGGAVMHARKIADILQSQGYKVEAVHGEIPAKSRINIFEAFESGEIDGLTFVDVLGEGWDSDRAKGLVNGRPTRSGIVAQQRLGRILRLGGPAFAIDIIDSHDPLNPPVRIADVVQQGDIDLGTVFGDLKDTGRVYVDQVIESLTARVGLEKVLRSDYQRFYDELDEHPSISPNGVLLGGGEGHYVIAQKVLSDHKGLTDEIIEKIAEMYSVGEDISRQVGVHNLALRHTYKRPQIDRLMRQVPIIDPETFYTDPEGQRWISAVGIEKMFAKRYPRLTARRAEEIIDHSAEQKEWIPLRYITGQDRQEIRLRAVKAYKANPQDIDFLDNLFRSRAI